MDKCKIFIDTLKNNRIAFILVSFKHFAKYKNK